MALDNFNYHFFSFLLECARVFHAAGAKLVLCGRNVKALEELTRELAASSQVSLQQGFYEGGRKNCCGP